MSPPDDVGPGDASSYQHGITTSFFGIWIILVAWDGTREANRALNDALPLLEEAQSATVMLVDATERELDHRRLVDQGWTDALRALHQGERIYTFWKYFRNAFARNAGLRIDHLLLSPAIAGRLITAAVDRDIRGRERASDHAPVWIELAEAKSGSSRRRRERDA
jgi:exonuclease III